MEKITRYVIYNDGVEYEYIPAGNRNEPRWCKDVDVKKLEIKIEALKSEIERKDRLIEEASTELYQDMDGIGDISRAFSLLNRALSNNTEVEG